MRALTLDGSMFGTIPLGMAGVADIRLLTWPALPVLMPFLLGSLRLAMGAGLGLAIGAMTPLPLFWLGAGLMAGVLLQVWVRPAPSRSDVPSGVVRVER